MVNFIRERVYVWPTAVDTSVEGGEKPFNQGGISVRSCKRKLVELDIEKNSER